MVLTAAPLVVVIGTHIVREISGAAATEAMYLVRLDLAIAAVLIVGAAGVLRAARDTAGMTRTEAALLAGACAIAVAFAAAPGVIFSSPDRSFALIFTIAALTAGAMRRSRQKEALAFWGVVYSAAAMSAYETAFHRFVARLLINH